MDEILAIIPARSGSRGVPNKNTRCIAGKPLIVHAVESALKSKNGLRVIVSTEDAAIAEAARAAGAEVPFLRPQELAQDETPMLPVVQHALRWLEEHEGYQPEVVVLLQPTSPLRTAQHIDAAIHLLLETGADSVISVCEAEHSPYWMWRVGAEGRATRFMEEGARFPRRQELPPVYRPNGALYVTRRNVIVREGRLLGDDLRALIMESEDSVDIDTEVDFLLAALLLKERSIRGPGG